MLNTKHASPSAEQNWLVSHRDAFLDAMRKQHYATRTLGTYQSMTNRLCGWVRELGISCDGLDAVALDECALTCPLTGSKTMARDFAQVTGRFIDFLVKTGVIAERPAGALSEPDFLAQLCMDLVQWLRLHRGMFGGRLRIHENMLSDFAAYCADGGSVDEALHALTPAKIHAYLAQVSGKVHWRVPYLRNILRFLFWRGLTACDLSGSIPRTGESKSGETVRHLDAETVGRLLAATRGESAREMRDYAMLLIMFRLGLRAQEVIALQLDDFDWRNGTVRIRGKGGQLDAMPLPVDVGEALVSWICNARKGDSRHVFVSIYAPFNRIASSVRLATALRIAYERAGLNPPSGEVRTHAMRHSLAMSLLRQDQSLEEVGNVLRHRSQQSTTVYARYDIDALRPLARPWPTATGAVR